MAVQTRDTRDAISLFRDRMDTVEPGWEARKKRYRDNYKQLLAHQVPGPYNSKISTKYTDSQLRVHTSFATMGVLPTKPWVAGAANEDYRMYPVMGPMGPTVVDVGEWATEEYQARLEEIDFYWKVYRWYRLAGAYGVGIAKMTWAGSVILGLVNPADIAWDPKAYNLRNDALYVIEKHDRQTLAMIMARRKSMGGDYNDEAVKELAQLVSSDLTHDDELYEERTGESPAVPIKMDKAVLLHDMVMNDRIITVHNDSELVLRDRPNPLGYINYYDLCPYPEVFQIQGYSIPEQLEGIQREINTIRQQRTDVRSLQANPIGLIRRGSGLNIRSLQSRPGALWPVGDVDSDVKFLQMQDTGAGLLQEEGILNADGDRTTGVMPHTRGERGAEMKATVANMLHTNVNVRFAASMKSDMDYPFRHVLQDFVELCHLYDMPARIPLKEWAVLRQAAEEGAIELRLRPESHVGNPFAKIQVIQQIATFMAGFTTPSGLALMAKQMLRLADVEDSEKIMQFVAPIPLQGTPAQTNLGASQGQGVAQTGATARSQAPGQAPQGGPSAA